MIKILHLFLFDLKLLRVTYFFPFIAYAVCLVLLFSVGIPSDEPFLSYVFIQGIAISMAGWHIIFVYHALYEEGAEEALMPYYRKIVWWDLLRYAVLHGLFIGGFLVVIGFINGFSFYTTIILAHFLLLFLFYQVAGIALLTFTKNMELTLAVLVTYTFMEVVTQGTFMPWPHLFLFLPPIIDVWLYLTFISLGLGIFVSLFQIWRVFK